MLVLLRDSHDLVALLTRPPDKFLDRCPLTKSPAVRLVLPANPVVVGESHLNDYDFHKVSRSNDDPDDDSNL